MKYEVDDNMVTVDMTIPGTPEAEIAEATVDVIELAEKAERLRKELGGAGQDPWRHVASLLTAANEMVDGHTMLDIMLFAREMVRMMAHNDEVYKEEAARGVEVHSDQRRSA